MIEWHVGPSPLGHIVYRAENEYLTGLFFVGQKHFPDGSPEPALSDTAPKSRAIAAAREQIAEYFAGGVERKRHLLTLEGGREQLTLF